MITVRRYDAIIFKVTVLYSPNFVGMPKLHLAEHDWQSMVVRIAFQ